MSKIVSLAKRRGFIFPSSEIYGGFSSCYDYGPLGVELKNNIKRLWWDYMVTRRPDIVGLDAAILMAPKVWEASGHLSAGFADALRECRNCHKRFRLDVLTGERCLECGGELTQERKFNLMMKTFAGAVEDASTVTYLRGETAQGIYVNFPHVLDSMHMKIPFGIAQIGKAFRNEITPGNFIFRTREFEQMEMQFFIRPRRPKREKLSAKKKKAWGAREWFEYWKEERMKWYRALGVRENHLRFKKHKKTELAHYARAAEDIEYRYPFGWGELEGIHDRGDWDLSNHSRLSGKDLGYFDEGEGTRYTPHIIETSAGADRSLLVFLLDAYHEENVRGEQRIVLRFHPQIAPIKVAVLPLVKNKPRIVNTAKNVFQLLLPHFRVMYDESGSIGRRYRRQDEVGTPYAVTVDFESVSGYDVTLRDRDTMKQIRVKAKDLVGTLKRKLGDVS